MGCTSIGARAAAERIYRENITAADPLDLSAGPLAEAPAPNLNRGLQGNDGQTVVISVVFANPGETADLAIVNWGRPKTGDPVPISVRELTQITGGDLLDGAQPYASELVEPCNAPQFEIRVRAITGTIVAMRVWTY